MKLDAHGFLTTWQANFANNSTGDIKPETFQQFVKDIVESLFGEIANAPLWVAGTTYQQGDFVRYTVDGNRGEETWYALLAGVLSAPSSSTTSWRRVAPPVPATQFGQHVDLLTAGGMDGAYTVEGRLYAIQGAPTAGVTNPNVSCWNQDGQTRTIYVWGFENYFEREGVLLDSDGIPQRRVQVDVAAGTYRELSDRRAPAGTTLVQLKADSPQDYGTGTSTSGQFVVDGTGAVPGVCVSFRLDAGAPAPQFVNGTFDPVGPAYSGSKFGYSLLVLSDCIQVARYARS